MISKNVPTFSVCVCVCVKMKRECQSNGKHDKQKSQAQWNEKYRTGRGPFASQVTVTLTRCVCVCACVRACFFTHSPTIGVLVHQGAKPSAGRRVHATVRLRSDPCVVQFRWRAGLWTHGVSLISSAFFFSFYCTVNLEYSLGAVTLVLWRHRMNVLQVHSVTENQFHCTRLYYVCILFSCFSLVRRLP